MKTTRFFEDKKQKAFVLWPRLPSWVTMVDKQKFFGSFFQKISTSF